MSKIFAHTHATQDDYCNPPPTLRLITVDIGACYSLQHFSCTEIIIIIMVALVGGAILLIIFIEIITE